METLSQEGQRRLFYGKGTPERLQESTLEFSFHSRELQLDMVETEVGAPKLTAPRLDQDFLPLQRLPRVEPVEPPRATRISLEGLGAFTT